MRAFSPLPSSPSTLPPIPLFSPFLHCVMLRLVFLRCSFSIYWYRMASLFLSFQGKSSSPAQFHDSHSQKGMCPFLLFQRSCPDDLSSPLFGYLFFPSRVFYQLCCFCHHPSTSPPLSTPFSLFFGLHLSFFPTDSAPSLFPFYQTFHPDRFTFLS